MTWPLSSTWGLWVCPSLPDILISKQFQTVLWLFPHIYVSHHCFRTWCSLEENAIPRSRRNHTHLLSWCLLSWCLTKRRLWNRSSHKRMNKNICIIVNLLSSLLQVFNEGVVWGERSRPRASPAGQAAGRGQLVLASLRLRAEVVPFWRPAHIVGVGGGERWQEQRKAVLRRQRKARGTLVVAMGWGIGGVGVCVCWGGGYGKEGMGGCCPNCEDWRQT